MPIAQLNGLTLHYETAGNPENPTVVLSNSIGTNVALWAPIVDRLAEHFHVVTYDSRGHGQSSTPEGEYTLADLAGDIAGLLDVLGVAKTHLVGLSIGGQTGLAFALNHPERLDRLVVTNTGAKIGTQESWGSRAATVRTDGLGAIADAVIAGWLTPDYAAAHPELVETMHEWFLANDPEGYAATCNALAQADLRGDLAQITAPTLVIGATGDVPTPPALTKQIADGIPGGTFVEIPGAHLSVQESPDDFVAAVLDHLRS